MTKSSNNRSQDLAEDRTDLAEDRTVMAAERTYAGWLRTSFAAIAIGLAFRGLFGDLQPPWLARVIATAFMLLAAALAIGAERRVCRTFARLNAHKTEAPRTPNLRWMAYGIAAGALVMAVSVWVMEG